MLKRAFPLVSSKCSDLYITNIHTQAFNKQIYGTTYLSTHTVCPYWIRDYRDLGRMRRSGKNDTVKRDCMEKKILKREASIRKWSSSRCSLNFWTRWTKQKRKELITSDGYLVSVSLRITEINSLPYCFIHRAPDVCASSRLHFEFSRGWYRYSSRNMGKRCQEYGGKSSGVDKYVYCTVLMYPINKQTYHPENNQVSQLSSSSQFKKDEFFQERRNIHFIIVG